jgi:hypothetical protein
VILERREGRWLALGGDVRLPTRMVRKDRECEFLHTHRGTGGAIMSGPSSSRGGGSEGEPKTKWVDLGKKVAEEIITLRANEGAAAAESCRP